MRGAVKSLRTSPSKKESVGGRLGALIGSMVTMQKIDSGCWEYTVFNAIKDKEVGHYRFRSNACVPSKLLDGFCLKMGGYFNLDKFSEATSVPCDVEEAERIHVWSTVPKDTDSEQLLRAMESYGVHPANLQRVLAEVKRIEGETLPSKCNVVEFVKTLSTFDESEEYISYRPYEHEAFNADDYEAHIMEVKISKFLLDSKMHKPLPLDIQHPIESEHRDGDEDEVETQSLQPSIKWAQIFSRIADRKTVPLIEPDDQGHYDLVPFSEVFNFNC